MNFGKKNKIFLIIAPPWGYDMPPLGLAYLSSYLKSKNIETEILDINAHLFRETNTERKELWNLENIRCWVEKKFFKPLFESFRTQVSLLSEKILVNKYTAIGFSVNRSNLLFSLEIAKILKSKHKDIKIILGGPSCFILNEASNIPQECYDPLNQKLEFEPGLVDFFVLREGEIALYQILQNLNSRKELKKIGGITFFNGQHYEKGKNISAIENLDDLPFPNFQEFDLNLYTEKKLPVLFSRGCIGRCNFCNDHVFYPTYRKRNPKKIVEELTYHINHNQINFFHSCDLLLNGDLKQLETICDLIIEKQLKIKWTGQAIARKEMTLKLYQKMKKAGCVSLVLGIESFSDRVLKVMNKRVTSKDIEKNIELLHKAEMEVVLNLIVGFPGETKEDIDINLKALAKNKDYIKSISSLSLYMTTKKSAVFEQPEKFHISLCPSGDMAMWVGNDGSNYNIRKKRAQKIISQLQSLNIPVLSTSFYDESLDQQHKKLKDKDQDIDLTLVLCPSWGTMMPPIGLGFLEEYLERHKLNVSIIDANIELFNQATSQQKHFWNFNSFSHWIEEETFAQIKETFAAQIQKLAERIIATKSKVIGFSIFSPNRLFSIEVIKKIKEKNPEQIIVVGGRGCATQGDRALFKPESIVDLFVTGEGEKAILKIAKAVKAGPALKNIAGLAQEAAGNILKEPGVEDLSSMHFPTYQNFDLTQYTDTALPLLFSRGCIGACAFCSDCLEMGRFRVRQASEMFAEIHYHYYQHKIEHFWFNDPAINSKPQELEKLCDLIIESGIKIRWNALAIPKKDLTSNLLAKIKKAGCYSLNFGLEAGSDTLLKKMNKTLFTIKEAEKVLENAQKVNLPNRINFIIGFPGETEAELKETLTFLERNKKNIYRVNNVNVCIALSDSPLSKNHQKYNISLPLKSPDKYWYDNQGNNYDLRLSRLEKVKQKLKELDMPYEISNTEEKEANIAMLKQKEPALDILLIMCPPWGIDMPPLGIAYLATFLKHKNLKVDAADFNVETYWKVDKKKQKLWEMENIRCWQEDDFFKNLLYELNAEVDSCVNEIFKKDSQVIGFSVNQSNMKFSIEIAKKIKEKDESKIIIFGGPETYWDCKDKIFPSGIYNHLTDEIMIHPGLIDVFVRGEGEETLYEVLKAVKNNLSLENIPGTIAFIKGRYTTYIPRKLIKNIDTLPFPTFAEFKLEKYLEPKIPILSSRGCINKCRFCNDHIMMQKYRFRSAEHIFAEIKYHMEKRGIGYLHFCDVLINGNLKELEKLCDLMIASPHTFGWSGQAFIRTDMSVQLLQKLKQAGCSALVFGVESCSNEVLERMNKKYTPEQIKTVLSRVKQAGMETVINLIVGFPGETEKEFYETVNFIETNRQLIDKISSVQTLHLTTGSEIDMHPQKFGIIRPQKESWFRWYTKAGNTYEIRKNRLIALSIALQKLKIPIFSMNLYEDNIAEQRKIFTLTPQNNEEKTLSKLELQKNFKPNEASLEPGDICFNEDSDILIFNSPPWGVNNPPLGMAYLASYLEQNRVKAEVFDFNIYLYKRLGEKWHNFWHVENKNFWSNEKTFPKLAKKFENIISEVAQAIISSRIKIIGFSVVDPKERITIDLIKRIKEKAPDKKIILGGPACSTKQARGIFIDNIADSTEAFVLGEGEATLIEAIERINKNQPLQALPGAVTRKNGSWEYVPRKAIHPLDIIPFPDYKKFNLEDYGKSSLLLEWSRGCAGSCAFCKNHTLVPGYRMHSARHIAEELIYHTQENKINQFTVCDSIMNGNLNVLNEVSELVIKENLKIDINGQLAPRGDMSEELFHKLKTAGINRMQFGLESGSDKVLKLMKKKYTTQEVEITLKRAKKAGVETEIFIIIGFPGEEENDFKMTIDFIKRNRPYIDTIKSINTLHLIAGTDVYENPAAHNLNLPKHNWHYLWETKDGKNNYEIRKRRAEILFNLALESNIKVKETNLKEGKETNISAESRLDELLSQANRLQKLTKEAPPHIAPQQQPPLPAFSELEFLKKEISKRDLAIKEIEQELDNIRKSRSFKLVKQIVKTKHKFLKTIRHIYRLPILLFLLVFSLVMETYLYLLRKYRGSIIFPGG